MNKRKQLLKYLICDFIAAALSWSIFYFSRKIFIESQIYGYRIPVTIGYKFLLALIFIPIFWIFLYYLSGYYREVIRKSRLTELGHTLFTVILGTILIFFFLVIDDTINTYSDYYNSIAILFSFHFILTYFPRLIITSIATKKIHSRIVGFNTIIVGSNKEAIDIFNEIENQELSSGQKFVGFINTGQKNDDPLKEYLPYLGNIDDIKKIIKEHKIEEVVIAIESFEHDKIEQIINQLLDSNVIIKAIPSMYDILTGRVRMSAIFNAPLVQISHDLMPAWQENIKFFIDKVGALLALLLLSPLFLFLMIAIKLTSKGPIFYSHERIGRYGKPFTIYKFRSMYVDAEINGPELSSKNDPRITNFGVFMRKSKFDEIPNFYNVLRGDMSLVGPRPERKYFMEQIIKVAPHYVHLLKVRPGITSWGQVKFGYAENVEQMTKRLKYDLIYLDNMSLYVDLKILIYTVLTIIKGKGI